MFVSGRTLCPGKSEVWKAGHLSSRHEVGEILRQLGVETIEFRAGMVAGTGSLSNQLMKSLIDRLPVTYCREWLTTLWQPIAMDDTLAYYTDRSHSLRASA